MNEPEPTSAALEELRAMLAERNVILAETREVDGQPWVLVSPELMMHLIRDKEQAEAELAEPVKDTLVEMLVDPPSRCLGCRYLFELAELKARRCETCRFDTWCNHNIMVFAPGSGDPDVSIKGCANWVAREDMP